MIEQILELKYQHFTSPEQMSPEDRTLISAARHAAEQSHSPYSNFRVGAAARLSTGEIVTAANVESEVYPAGVCAERNLLFNTAVNHREATIEAMAITSTSTSAECYPCGICRQSLLDSERRQNAPIRVIMAGDATATVVESATALLPFSFNLNS